MMMQRVYQYRYMDDRAPVFYIGRLPTGANGGHVVNRMVYTIPYSSKEARDTRNALLGFASKGVAMERLSEMQYTASGTPIESNMDIDLFETSLCDFKHLSAMVMCPLVVEIDSFCDIRDVKEYVDVFYYQPRDSDFSFRWQNQAKRKDKH